MSAQRLCAVKYGGWAENTYVHVIPRGRAGAKVNIHVQTLHELDGVVYHMQVKTTKSRHGVLQGVPLVSREDVRICT